MYFLWSLIRLENITDVKNKAIFLAHLGLRWVLSCNSEGWAEDNMEEGCVAPQLWTRACWGTVNVTKATKMEGERPSSECMRDAEGGRKWKILGCLSWSWNEESFIRAQWNGTRQKNHFLLAASALVSNMCPALAAVVPLGPFLKSDFQPSARACFVLMWLYSLMGAAPFCFSSAALGKLPLS